ncbi:hypothetical protein GPX89_19805 [Nocardia sp. ET3-3]|uniref:Uncharacterized protein n=1 Tax=Nocardia terrae TaxID=2675851 RepID=A0A7K1UYL8_9NOCA|nr:hypothetical protein [Nocardia terrae]MVU79480.1 hypothetical protein [Nocardia terrae]
MSEMDEITQEAGRFTGAMAQALTQLAHATNWLERRRIKKDISRLVREQTRQAEAARALEVQATAEALETYRQHSSRVSTSANNPGSHPDRRAHDRKALARHHDQLKKQVLQSDLLTPIEQGIALDGMDAATTFPEFKLGKLFSKARKVKGVDALRYRAQVARAHAETGIERPPAYRTPPTSPDRSQPGAEQRLAEVEKQLAVLTADRDQQARQVQVLQRGLDAVTSDRDNHKRRVEAAEAEVATLKNANTRQAAELKSLRDTVITVGVERDKFKTERDQAVGKLKAATPEHDRYGSRERVAAENNGVPPDQQRTQPQRPNGIERSR